MPTAALGDSSLHLGVAPAAVSRLAAATRGQKGTLRRPFRTADSSVLVGAVGRLVVFFPPPLPEQLALAIGAAV